MGKLSGKIALVTGGNSGIGLATAHLFRQEGAKVIVTASSEQRKRESADTVGADIEIVVTDLSKKASIDSLFEHIKSEYGKLDVLFANAGIAFFQPFETIDEAFIDRQFDVNFKGVFFTVQNAVPLFSDGGAIVINTSVNNSVGMPTSSVYGATKAAARSLARTLSAELVEKGIRVNAVSPGPVETPIFGKMGMPQEQLEAFGQQVEGMVPLGRFGKPDEIAKAALFLASEDSSFIVGAELVADGGMTQL